MARDAWKKLHDLQERYTKNIKVRADLRVTAHALDRGVEIEVGRLNPEADHLSIIRYTWMSSGSRNVSTMRELAAALNEACDFVEASNPEWAGK